MDGVPVPEGGVQDSGGFYSTPWALSEKYFLVSYTYGDKDDGSESATPSTWSTCSATRN